ARARFVLPVQSEAAAVRRPSAAARGGDVEALGDFPAEAVVELLIAVPHGRSSLTSANSMKLDALVFDAYGTLFDVHSVMRRCEACWSGKGAALSAAWRAKQLEYTWQRS